MEIVSTLKSLLDSLGQTQSLFTMIRICENISLLQQCVVSYKSMWAVQLNVYDTINNIYYLCIVLFVSSVWLLPAEVSCGSPAESVVAP